MQQLTLPKFGYGCWQLGSKGTDDYWGLEFTDDMAAEFVASTLYKTSGRGAAQLKVEMNAATSLSELIDSDVTREVLVLQVVLFGVLVDANRSHRRRFWLVL